MTNINYRQLTTPDEFKEATVLQKTVWGLSDADLLAAHTLCVFTHVGGVVLGGFDNEQLIGFTAALPRRSGGGWALWSDMMGVHPDYQRLGIGLRLKFMQREWALSNDYNTVGWTFDPLQRGNANLNIRRLWAVGNIYHVNMYGVFNDNLSAGMRTDRMEVVWDLNHPGVSQRASGDVPAATNPDAPFLLSMGENGDLNTADIDPEQCHYRVEIPLHFIPLRETNLQKAQEWQLKLAAVMQAAFAQDYTVVDFVTVHDRCWYVMGCR